MNDPCETSEASEATGRRWSANPSAARARAWRPREKLLARGPRSLTHEELFDLVLGPNRGAAARRWVRRHGLRSLAQRPAGEARVRAVFELGRRAYAAGAEHPRPQIARPGQAWPHLRRIGRARREHLVGLYLDAQNGLLRRETLSIGSLNTTRTHPREILYPAVVHLALGFILAHNHPSGCLEPSREDVEFTHAVRRAGELMGIDLYDHLIVGREGYTSLRERGLL